MTVLLGIGLYSIVYRSVHTGAEAPADRDGASAKRGPVTPESAELTGLRQELIQLKRQMWTQGQMLSATDSAKTGAQNPAGAKDLHTDPEARAEQERKYREYMASVDATFRNESTDPRWSSATSSVARRGWPHRHLASLVTWTARITPNHPPKQSNVRWPRHAAGRFSLAIFSIQTKLHNY